MYASFDDEIKTRILRKLARKRIWGRKHTAFEHTYKGVPAELEGVYKRIAGNLIKEGSLLPKTTHYGLRVSLNPRKITEIEEHVYVE